MVTPTQSTAPVVAAQNAPIAPAATPPGIGATPSSLSSPLRKEFGFEEILQKIKHFASSLISYVQSLFTEVKEAIRSWLSTLSEEASEQPNSNWVIAPPANPPSATQPNDPFEALPLTATEQQKIYTLIHNMGTKSIIGLAAMQSHMKKIGNEIQHVHPLRFLGYIFQHPELPFQMKEVSNSAFKWSPFLQGLAENFSRESATLPECKTGFARALNINLSDLDPFFASANWEGMVKFLIDVKTGKQQSLWASSNPPPITTAAEPSLPGVSTTTESSLLSDLTIDPVHLQTMRSILETYKKTNAVVLAIDDRKLKDQLATLEACHPFKLLSAVHADEAMKEQMKTLVQSYFKKGAFLSAFSSMLGKFPHDQVLPYVDDFVRVCRQSSQSTKVLVQNQSWQQIIENLIVT